MYLYSLIYSINALGFFTNDKTQQMIKRMVVVLLVFISGTRYYMGGSDVFVYEQVYKVTPSVKTVLIYIFTGVNHGVDESYEPGFLLLCSVIKTLHFSYFGFVLLCAAIFYVLLLKGLKDFVPSWSAFFAVFMYKIMFYNTFISIRQGLTLAIFCYSIPFIRDKKWYVYFPICCMAFMIHRGALFLFLLYFVRYIPISKRFIRNFALLLAPTWLLRDYVDISGILNAIIDVIGFREKSEGWATDALQGINFLHTLECYIVVILVLMFYEKIISNVHTEEVKLILQLFLMAIPIFTLFSGWIVMTRIKDYIVIVYGIIFGYILDGRTTSPLGVKNAYIGRYDIGVRNYEMIAFAIIAACFIGMTRYVYVFDGGVLFHFTSFLFKGGHIFAS